MPFAGSPASPRPQRSGSSISLSPGEIPTVGVTARPEWRSFRRQRTDIDEKEAALPKITLSPDTAVQFTKTVGESDVYLFAGITGDLAPNHVDAVFMAGTRYGERIAHGALMVGYMSTASTRVAEEAARQGSRVMPVSLGYDRIRFINAVRIGDTITVDYTIDQVDQVAMRTTSRIEVKNQKGELVAVATHIMKWLEAETAVHPG